VLVLVPTFRGEAAAPKGWIDLQYGGAPWRDDPAIKRPEVDVPPQTSAKVGGNPSCVPPSRRT
jgi:hypothetical protein